MRTFALCTVTAVLVVVAACSSATPNSPAFSRSALSVSGRISAPGGPFLYDRYGRIVLLHGVNAVYKRAPYELFPAKGKSYNFSAADAEAIARMGFNVVRLGMTWQGIEPGNVGPNDPAICSPGAPHNPGQWNESIARAYLARLSQTVDLLGRYHIYTLLDMHQDVYSAVFGGDGAPPWAVCTDGLPTGPLPGRWSHTYASPALHAAFDHFWRNDVRGDLEGEYERAWAAVASYFRSNPWVIGYDLMNEPFSTVFTQASQRVLDSQIECLYTGSAQPGRSVDQDVEVSCPKQTPDKGLIPTILHIDHRHLIFYEPDIYANRDGPNYVGPMNFSNLVFSFHSYCPERNGVTGDPINVAACALHETSTIERRATERQLLSTDKQPAGPPWFLSEFGATTSTDLLESLTDTANQNLLGWAYWQWKYYDDPTGSSHEALVSNQGKWGPQVSVLSQTYPQATAGTPLSISFDPASARFSFVYKPSIKIKAPTVIFVPTRLHYPRGHCTQVSGGTVVPSGAQDLLDVANDRTAKIVTVSIVPGRCT